jgi:hypothetical protein
MGMMGELVKVLSSTLSHHRKHIDFSGPTQVIHTAEAEHGQHLTLDHILDIQNE